MIITNAMVKANAADPADPIGVAVRAAGAQVAHDAMQPAYRQSRREWAERVGRPYPGDEDSKPCA